MAYQNKMFAPYELLVVVHDAENLAVADLTTSDPYVIVTLANKIIGRTATVYRNHRSPSWEQSFSSSLLHRNNTLLLKVFDEDQHKNDDLLGFVEVDLSHTKLNQMQKHKIAVQNNGKIKSKGSLSFSIYVGRNEDIVDIISVRNDTTVDHDNLNKVYSNSMSHFDNLKRNLSAPKCIETSLALIVKEDKHSSLSQMHLLRDLFGDIDSMAAVACKNHEPRTQNEADEIIAQKKFQSFSQLSFKRQQLHLLNSSKYSFFSDTWHRCPPLEENCIQLNLDANATYFVLLQFPSRFAVWMWIRWFRVVRDVWAREIAPKDVPDWASTGTFSCKMINIYDVGIDHNRVLNGVVTMSFDVVFKLECSCGEKIELFALDSMIMSCDSTYPIGDAIMEIKLGETILTGKKSIVNDDSSNYGSPEEQANLSQQQAKNSGLHLFHPLQNLKTLVNTGVGAAKGVATSTAGVAVGAVKGASGLAVGTVKGVGTSAVGAVRTIATGDVNEMINAAGGTVVTVGSNIVDLAISPLNVIAYQNYSYVIAKVPGAIFCTTRLTTDEPNWNFPLYVDVDTKKLFRAVSRNAKRRTSSVITDGDGGPRDSDISSQKTDSSDILTLPKKASPTITSSFPTYEGYAIDEADIGLDLFLFESDGRFAFEEAITGQKHLLLSSLLSKNNSRCTKMDGVETSSTVVSVSHSQKFKLDTQIGLSVKVLSGIGIPTMIIENDHQNLYKGSNGHMFVKLKLCDANGHSKGKNLESYRTSSVPVSKTPFWSESFVFRAINGIPRAQYIRLDLHITSNVMLSEDIFLGSAFVPFEYFQFKEKNIDINISRFTRNKMSTSQAISLFSPWTSAVANNNNNGLGSLSVSLQKVELGRILHNPPQLDISSRIIELSPFNTAYFAECVLLGRITSTAPSDKESFSVFTNYDGLQFYENSTHDAAIPQLSQRSSSGVVGGAASTFSDSFFLNSNPADSVNASSFSSSIGGGGYSFGEVKSLTSAVGGNTDVEVAIYENQRRSPLPPFDWDIEAYTRPKYSDMSYKEAYNIESLTLVSPPDGCDWTDEWKIDKKHLPTDENGWIYGFRFSAVLAMQRKKQSITTPFNNHARRRKWIRHASSSALSVSSLESSLPAVVDRSSVYSGGGGVDRSTAISSAFDPTNRGIVDITRISDSTSNWREEIIRLAPAAVLRVCEEKQTLHGTINIPWDQVYSTNVISSSILSVSLKVHRYFGEKPASAAHSSGNSSSARSGCNYIFKPADVEVFVSNCPAESLKSLIDERMLFHQARCTMVSLIATGTLDGQAPSPPPKQVSMAAQVLQEIDFDRMTIEHAVGMVDGSSFEDVKGRYEDEENDDKNYFPDTEALSLGSELIADLDNDCIHIEDRIIQLERIFKNRNSSKERKENIHREIISLSSRVWRIRLYMSLLLAAGLKSAQPISVEVARKIMRGDFERYHSIILDNDVATTNNRIEFLLDMAEKRIRDTALCGWSFRGNTVGENGTLEKTLRTYVNGYLIEIVGLLGKFFDVSGLDEVKGLQSKIELLNTFMKHNDRLELILNSSLRPYGLMADPPPKLSLFLDFEVLTSWYATVLQADMRTKVDDVLAVWRDRTKDASGCASLYTHSLPWFPQRQGMQQNTEFVTLIPEDTIEYLFTYLAYARMKTEEVAESFRSSIAKLDLKICLSFTSAFLHLSLCYKNALAVKTYSSASSEEELVEYVEWLASCANDAFRVGRKRMLSANDIDVIVVGSTQTPTPSQAVNRNNYEGEDEECVVDIQININNSNDESNPITADMQHNHSTTVSSSNTTTTTALDKETLHDVALAKRITIETYQAFKSVSKKALEHISCLLFIFTFYDRYQLLNGNFHLVWLQEFEQVKDAPIRDSSLTDDDSQSQQTFHYSSSIVDILLSDLLSSLESKEEFLEKECFSDLILICAEKFVIFYMKFLREIYMSSSNELFISYGEAAVKKVSADIHMITQRFRSFLLRYECSSAVHDHKLKASMLVLELCDSLLSASTKTTQFADTIVALQEIATTGRYNSCHDFSAFTPTTSPHIMSNGIANLMKTLLGLRGVRVYRRRALISNNTNVIPSSSGGGNRKQDFTEKNGEPPSSTTSGAQGRAGACSLQYPPPPLQQHQSISAARRGSVFLGYLVQQVGAAAGAAVGSSTTSHHESSVINSTNVESAATTNRDTQLHRGCDDSLRDDNEDDEILLLQQQTEDLYFVWVTEIIDDLLLQSSRLPLGSKYQPNCNELSAIPSICLVFDESFSTGSDELSTRTLLLESAFSEGTRRDLSLSNLTNVIRDSSLNSNSTTNPGLSNMISSVFSGVFSSSSATRTLDQHHGKNRTVQIPKHQASQLTHAIFSQQQPLVVSPNKKVVATLHIRDLAAHNLFFLDVLRKPSAFLAIKLGESRLWKSTVVKDETDPNWAKESTDNSCVDFPIYEDDVAAGLQELTIVLCYEGFIYSQQVGSVKIQFHVFDLPKFTRKQFLIDFEVSSRAQQTAKAIEAADGILPSLTLSINSSSQQGGSEK